MREGLDAPTFELPPDNVAAIRAFLDGQSRIKLAVWVRHEQQGVDGPLYDHHVGLAVEDEDWRTGDMQALDAGLRLPLHVPEEPTWIDIAPLSEVEPLRSFGTVLWEQTSPGLDPLDYRFTFEPFEPEPQAAAQFARLVSALPAVRRVGADVAELWKGPEVVESTVRLFVDAPFEANALRPVVEAAHASVLAGRRSHSASVEPPEESTTILYEAVDV